MTAPAASNNLHISCADIVPECPFTATATSEAELLEQVIAHAAHDHGISEVTPALAAQVRAAIKTR